jgi:hypothetical protein
MVISGRELRPATKGEMTDFQVRDAASREPVRVPGLGKEGLAQLLANVGAPGASTAEGFLITCTCGHLFLDELPG